MQRMHHRLKRAVPGRKPWQCLLLAFFLVLCFGGRLSAQGGGLLVNLATLDGVPVTPDNIFSYMVQSGLPSNTDAIVKGTLRYRQNGLSLGYSFHTTIRPGLNQIGSSGVRPEWTFSTGALRDLFLNYKVLPEGTYEYCVTISPVGSNGEVIAGAEAGDCLYNRAEDLFLINLVDPEDDAKLYEHYPVFSWIVNYPFASQLTYRIRVAEIKEGQNTVAAVSRNNPVYTESHLPQTTTTYPVYGTPLKTGQPYGWTVDAYYRGILLGGAAPWKFTIVEDSELKSIPREVSYLDIKKESGISRAYAIGKLKLKYVLADLKRDSLSLRLSQDGQIIDLDKSYLLARQGDNRYEIDFYTAKRLRHLKTYTLEILSQTGEKFTVQFKYVNPDFL